MKSFQGQMKQEPSGMFAKVVNGVTMIMLFGMVLFNWVLADQLSQCEVFVSALIEGE